MKTPHIRRVGLTLMELIVVLTILAALAALVIPLLPSMLTRGRVSTSAANASDLNKFVQVYQQVNQGYPVNLDNLVVGGIVPSYIMPGIFTPLTLSSDQINALNNSAVADGGGNRNFNVITLSATTTSPTFNPYPATTTPVSVGTAKVVAQVPAALVEDPTTGLIKVPNFPSADIYVAFGLGSYSTIVGKTIVDAPIHFGDSGADRADLTYARYVLVFRVTSGSSSQPLSKAVFVGAAALEPSALSGVNANLSEFYKLNSMN